MIINRLSLPVVTDKVLINENINSAANKVVRYPLPSCGTSGTQDFRKRIKKGPLVALLIHFPANRVRTQDFRKEKTNPRGLVDTLLQMCCRHIMGGQLLGPFLDPGEFSFIGRTRICRSLIQRGYQNRS